MNEGVKVLIERLKTNPEDFELVQDKNYKPGLKEGRFYWVSEQVRDYLSLGNQHLHLTLLMKEDLDALVNAFKEKHQQEFTDRVMRDLFWEEQELAPAHAKAQSAQSIGGGGTDPRLIHIGNSTTISPLEQNPYSQNQQLRALMDSGKLTSVSKGGTGTTATTGLLGTLTGIFK